MRVCDRCRENKSKFEFDRTTFNMSGLTMGALTDATYQFDLCEPCKVSLGDFLSGYLVNGIPVRPDAPPSNTAPQDHQSGREAAERVEGE